VRDGDVGVADASPGRRNPLSEELSRPPKSTRKRASQERPGSRRDQMFRASFRFDPVAYLPRNRPPVKAHTRNSRGGASAR
jgi:hypothetical protein